MPVDRKGPGNLVFNTEVGRMEAVVRVAAEHRLMMQEGV
jgi:hypothetical protein